MKNSLTNLAVSSSTLAIHVTPTARSNKVETDAETIKVSVTATPANGKANAAVIKLLSKALGIAKTRLTLVRGHSSRDKVFRID